MHELPNRSLAVQRSALQSGALIPLKTELMSGPDERFQLRRLVSATPKHLAKAGPKPNPFRPWDQRLEVASLPEHVVLLNKYPVQAGHLLLITKHWQAQADWLQPSDWQALTAVWAEQPGLWFFNSSAAAGASQPHRHLQLLPRAADQPPCPLDEEFEALAEGQTPAQTWQQVRGHPCAQGQQRRRAAGLLSRAGDGTRDRISHRATTFRSIPTTCCSARNGW